MQVRNYLFSLSLLLFVGCAQQEADHFACKAQADSLSGVHWQVIDSLGNVIDMQKLRIQKLGERFSALKDSISNLPQPKRNPSQDLPEGLPTIVPRK